MNRLIERVLRWDESNDPAQAQGQEDLPRRMLMSHERELLDALADGTWVEESFLRSRLGWGRVRFFLVTLGLVRAGWIEARKPEGGTMWQSEYRVTPKVW